MGGKKLFKQLEKTHFGTRVVSPGAIDLRQWVNPTGNILLQWVIPTRHDAFLYACNMCSSINGQPLYLLQNIPHNS